MELDGRGHLEQSAPQLLAEAWVVVDDHDSSARHTYPLPLRIAVSDARMRPYGCIGLRPGSAEHGNCCSGTIRADVATVPPEPSASRDASVIKPPRRPGTQMLRVTIESLSYGGDAVAHLEDGRAAFVPFGCPGDVAEIEIVADKGRSSGRPISEIVTLARLACAAPCPYFGACGGCSWQHVAYAAQLAAKTARCRSTRSQRIGGRRRRSVVRECEGIASPVRLPQQGRAGRRPDRGTADPRLPPRRVGRGRSRRDAACFSPSALERAPKVASGALRYAGGERGARYHACRAARAPLHTATSRSRSGLPRARSRASRSLRPSAVP